MKWLCSGCGRILLSCCGHVMVMLFVVVLWSCCGHVMVGSWSGHVVIVWHRSTILFVLADLCRVILCHGHAVVVLYNVMVVLWSGRFMILWYVKVERCHVVFCCGCVMVELCCGHVMVVSWPGLL